MMVGVDSNGKYQEVKTNEDGNLEVVMADGGSGTETTLSASVQTVGTTATSISINKKVTSIDIANYSETANVTVGIDGSNYVIGANLATTLVINKDVANISLTSTEADTTVQIIVKEGKSAGKQKGFPPDWSEIGYEETPSGVMGGFYYAKEIQNNWDASITSMSNKYQGSKKLLIFPLVDTSNVTGMQTAFSNSNLTSLPLIDTSNVEYMNNVFTSTLLKSVPLLNTSKVKNMNYAFQDCILLEAIPLLDLSSVTSCQYMFNHCSELTTVPEFDLNNCTNNVYMFGLCPLLSNDSLNNILGMCAKATKITYNKTLSVLGLTQEQAEICETLPNYQAFLDAGWTSGY